MNKKQKQQKMTSQRRCSKTFLLVAIIFIGLFSMQFVSADLTTNLIGNWKLNMANQGNTLGKFENQTDTGINYIPGLIGNAANFTGTGVTPTTWINISNASVFQFGAGQFAINFWVNYTLASSMGLIGTYTPGDTGWMLYTETNNLKLRSGTGDSISLAGATTLNANRNYMITLVANTTNYTLYLNGAFEVAGARGAGLSVSGQDLTFGWIHTGSVNVFQGWMDEVSIWNRSITNAEITSLYNSSKGMGYPFGIGAGTSGSVTLNSPSNNSLIVSPTFNCSVQQPALTLTNLSLFINGVRNYTKSVSGVNFTDFSYYVTGLSYANYTNWTCIAYNSTSQSYIGANQTFNLTQIILGNTGYNPTTTVATPEPFLINVSYDSVAWSSITSTLWYNGTSYAGTKSGTGNNVGFSKTVTTPIFATSQNVSFYWTTSVSSSVNFSLNSTIYNQTVNQINLDNCTTYTTKIYNLTLYQEKLETTFNGTMEVSLQLFPFGSNSVIANFSTSFTNTSNGLICLDRNPNYRGYLHVKYYSGGFATENYYTQNTNLSNSSVSTIPQVVSLYDLNATESTEFLLTYKNENYLSVPGVLLVVNREYPAEGLFKTVEIDKTDNNGQGKAHLDTNGVVYTIIVTKEGAILNTFDHVTVSCQNNVEKCAINLFATSPGNTATNFNTYQNLNYLMTFNKATRVVNVDFNSIDGSSNIILLNVTQFDGWMNNSLCSSTVTTASGSIYCTIPSSQGNVTAFVELYMNGQFIISNIYTISNTGDTFKGNMLIYVLVLMLTIPMMFTPSAVGVIIGIFLGFGALAFMFGMGTTTIFPMVGAITWIIIIGLILIWRIQQKESG